METWSAFSLFPSRGNVAVSHERIWRALGKRWAQNPTIFH
jgi:hypothetical protein